MRKKLFIVPIFLMAISLAGCTPPVITNNYTLEAGDELPEEKATYASFKNSNLEIDESGYIITKPDSTRTNIKNVYAVGDVSNKKYKQAF